MNESESLESLIQGWMPLGVEIDAYLHSEKRILHISRIMVQKDLRKQGLGTKAMEDLAAFADQFGLMITLSPSTDFGGSSVDRLKRFYGRFGFVRNKGRNKIWEIRETMYRRPR